MTDLWFEVNGNYFNGNLSTELGKYSKFIQDPAKSVSWVTGTHTMPGKLTEEF